MQTMRIDILTLFPEMFASPLSHSILKRAQDGSVVDIVLTNIRDFAADSYRKVDDKPYGGGAGMVLMCQPVFDAVADVSGAGATVDEIVLLTPQGRRLDQQLAGKLAEKERLILIAG